MKQRALPLLHVAPAGPFLPAPSNERALAFLDAGAWPAGRLWLWGPPGTGKSHLLRLWTARQREAGIDAALLPASSLGRAVADYILPATGALALDDLDGLADEPALLHLLNLAAEAGVPLLLASRDSPARLAVALPDLASRVRATLAVCIDPPGDALLDALLARLLADRQLAVPPSVGRYLRARLPRDPDTLRRAVGRLDEASLERRRPITVALAGQLLEELGAPPQTLLEELGAPPQTLLEQLGAPPQTRPGDAPPDPPDHGFPSDSEPSSKPVSATPRHLV